MSKKKKKPTGLGRFIRHFHYLPNYPNNADYDIEEYDQLLGKCVDDDFDYTIELYGTDPTYGTQPWDGICID